MEVIRLWTIELGNQPWDHRVFDTRVFDSADSFTKQFREGLSALLRRDDLTASQLVLVANNAIAIGDIALFHEALGHIFRVQSEASAEDRAVLMYLATQKNNPSGVILRRVSESGLVFYYNRLREYRPQREAATKKVAGGSDVRIPLSRKFDEKKFNFSWIPNERFASVYLSCGRVDLYYNKYPYDGYHVLMVPVTENNYPQILNFGHVSLWQELNTMIARALPGYIMGYNSLGAYASINQLHFHLIYASEKLVIPARAGGFGQTIQGEGLAVWPHLEPIQAADQPFNLVQDSGGLTIIRQHGQLAIGPEWSTGFAWFEIGAGGFIFIDLSSFKTIKEAAVWAACRKLAVLAA